MDNAAPTPMPSHEDRPLKRLIGSVLTGYAALAILVAFFPVLGGRLPVPATNALFLLPERPPVADVNEELWDVPTQYLPWSRAIAGCYRSGLLPLRFAANGCGTPLWANPQAQALTPTTVFLLFLPESWASAAAAAARLFAAAAGTLLLVGRLGLSLPTAAWGGLVYGFSLTFTTWLHYPLTYPQAMLPWVLLAADRLVRGLPGGFAASLAAGTLLLLGGYPEGEFFVAIAAAAFFAVRVVREPRDGAKRVALAVLTALAALALSAILTLPQILAIRDSERSARIARGPGARAPGALPVPWRPPQYARLLEFWVVPEAEGNPRDGDKFGLWSFAGRASGYAGILVAAFALATYGWPRAPAGARWLQAGAALVALYILGYPLLSWALEAVPGVRQVFHRLSASRASGVLVLMLAALAALQLERNRRGEGRRATCVAAVFLLTAVGIVFGKYLLSSERLPTTPWRLTSFLLPFVLLFALILLLSGTWSRRRGSALTVFVLAATAVDLLRIGARASSGTPPGDYFPSTPTTRGLRVAAAGGRFAAGPGLMSAIANMYRLEDVSVQDPMTPARYEDALRAAAGYTGPEQPFAFVARLDAPILDFLNVRARLGPGAEIQRRDTPPAVLPNRLIGCRDDADVLEHLASAPDFLETAYAVGRDETFTGEARVVSVESPRPDEIRVRLEGHADRLLALPVSDDGGWTATAGGRALATLRVNHAFLGVRVPAGDHTVVCRYRPPGFVAGARISGATAALLALAAVLHRGRLRRGAASKTPIGDLPRSHRGA